MSRLRLLSAFFPAVLISSTAWAAPAPAWYISTFAGGGLPINIPGTSASLYGPVAVAVDTGGNIFFVDNNVVLRLDAKTNAVTLAAGNGTPGFSGDNGAASNAQLKHPYGVALDSSGNLYIADEGNMRVRKVSSGVITTVAGNGTQGSGGDNGAATSAQLSEPIGVAVDSSGNLYIADEGNMRVRKVSNGTITTVPASGTFEPRAVAVDPSGNLYVADLFTSSILKIAGGAISTVAGGGSSLGDNGSATSAQLSAPEGIAFDSAGNMYIADTEDARIRKVSGGTISTVAGNGTSAYGGDNGPATNATLGDPAGVAVDANGNFYIADFSALRIRKVSDGTITTVAGNGTQGFSGDSGPAPNAQIQGHSDVATGLGPPLPTPGVAVDSSGNVYIADALNNRVRKVTNGIITTVAGNGMKGYGGDHGPATSAQLNNPTGVAVDSSGNLYIADFGNQRIRMVSGGTITTVAGNGAASSGGDNGPAIAASLNGPQGVAVDSSGNLFIADTGNNLIRKVSGGTITSVAGDLQSGYVGDNGPATSAELNHPFGVAVDAAGNLYIADEFNSAIRKVSGGTITTVAGNGMRGYLGDKGPAGSAELSGPQGVAVDSAGNLYIADSGNSRIRQVVGGVINTIAGTATQGYSGDGGLAASAEVDDPVAIAVDSSGDVYFADFGNFRIRLMTAAPVPTINQGGIVPVYSAVPVVQSGSWVSVYGSNFANGDYTWNGDFPTSLGEVSVLIDGKPAYLWIVTPTQINLQVPDDATTGMVSVVVNTASSTAVSSVTLGPYGPSFSLLGDARHVVGEIATPDGSGAYGGGTYDLVGPAGAFSFNTRPVKPGESLVLFGVGFGPTTPNEPAGQVVSGAAKTNSPVTVNIGGVAANVAFAGIVEAGLYQINVTIPANAPAGDQSIVATVNGAQTPIGPVVTIQ